MEKIYKYAKINSRNIVDGVNTMAYHLHEAIDIIEELKQEKQLLLDKIDILEMKLNQYELNK